MNPMLDASGNSVFITDALIYPDISDVDLGTYTNLLLIDKNVAEYQDFVTSANSHTFTVVYSGLSSRDDLLSLISSGFNNFNRIGLLFETNDNGRVYPFLDRELLFTDSDLNGLNDFSPNMSFMVSLIKNLGIKNIDYLACNTLQFKNWANYYSVLSAETSVVVGASNNKTGNIKYGGDWVLESTGVDVEKVYFTLNIGYHKYLLVNAYVYKNTISLDTSNVTVNTNSIDTYLNTVLYRISGNIAIFTNNAILLGGGGSGRYSGYDGAHALVIDSSKNITNFINTGCLTGGGGGSNAYNPYGAGGDGGAGGGGGAFYTTILNGSGRGGGGSMVAESSGGGGFNQGGAGGIGGDFYHVIGSGIGGKGGKNGIGGGGGGCAGIGGHGGVFYNSNGGNGSDGDDPYYPGWGGGPGSGINGINGNRNGGYDISYNTNFAKQNGFGPNGGKAGDIIPDYINFYNVSYFNDGGGGGGDIGFKGGNGTNTFAFTMGGAGGGGAGANGGSVYDAYSSIGFGGGGGANSKFIFGGIGLGRVGCGGGGGAGGGNGGSYCGGGSGGGFGGNGAGNGGFGIKNNGSITTLSNSQNLSSNYGPLYITGNPPTNYNIIIQSDLSYGQLFASVNFPLNNSGNVIFDIDPSSNLTQGSKIYTNVLSQIFPSSIYGSGALSSHPYHWFLFTNNWTRDNSNNPVTNYDLVVNYDTSSSLVLLLNHQLINFDISNYALYNIPYGTTDVSGIYATVDPLATVDLSLNNLRVGASNDVSFDIPSLNQGDNSLNILVVNSDYSYANYFVNLHVSKSNSLNTLRMNGKDISFNIYNQGTILLPYSSTDISGIYTTIDPSANVDICFNHLSVSSMNDVSFNVSSLVSGDNKIYFSVTDYDHAFTKNYTVNVHVLKPASFTSLYLNNEMIHFDGSNNATNMININVLQGTNVSISGTYSLIDPFSNVFASIKNFFQIDPNFTIPLSSGSNKLIFYVLAGDNVNYTYYYATVNVNFYLNTITDNYINDTNYIDTSLNLTLFDISGNINTFTNNGNVLGGGGSGGNIDVVINGYDGANALIINSNSSINTLKNLGCLTGGGGGGSGYSRNIGGNGGAGGGGGSGGSFYQNGSSGGGGNYNNSGIYQVNGGGGLYKTGGGGGGFNGYGGDANLGNTPGGSPGMNGQNYGAGAGGGGGSNYVHIFGGYGAGGGAGGGSGIGGGGGSGGGLGNKTVNSSSGNGGFGIKNYGLITTLYNAQNLSSNYGPLYISGNPPTYYNIIIQGDASYGQFFASPNFPLNNGGNIIFGVDLSSNFHSGNVIYTNVLSQVFPTNFSSTGNINRYYSYRWDLSKNTTWTVNNFGIPVTNYDLIMNYHKSTIISSLSLNNQEITFDGSNNGNIIIPYGSYDISGIYITIDPSANVDISLNNAHVNNSSNNVSFNISSINAGDNSLNILVTGSDYLSSDSYFVKIYMQTSNLINTLFLNNQSISFDNTSYARIDISNGITDISGIYTTIDPSANVDVSLNNIYVNSTNDVSFDLSPFYVGDNSLNLLVKSYDGLTSKNYSVNVYVIKSSLINTLTLNNQVVAFDSSHNAFNTIFVTSYINNNNIFGICSTIDPSANIYISSTNRYSNLKINNNFNASLYSGINYLIFHIISSDNLGNTYYYVTVYNYVYLKSITTNYNNETNFIDNSLNTIIFDISGNIDSFTNNRIVIGGNGDVIDNIGYDGADALIINSNSSVNSFTNLGKFMGGSGILNKSYNGFGINNHGSITTLSNSQNTSSNYGPLYISGNPPTYYNVIIQGDTSYGQFFASVNSPLTNGGNVIFGVDPSSYLSFEEKTYTNVLSQVFPTNLSGSGYISQYDYSYSWNLTVNPDFTHDICGNPITNYDLNISTIKVSCLLEGTLVWSDDGYVPIETLKVGDSVQTQYYFISITKIGKWECDLNKEEDRNDLSKKMYKIPAGSYGATSDVFISHYHRFMFESGEREDNFNRLMGIPEQIGLFPADPSEYSKNGKYTLYHLEIKYGNHYMVNGGCRVESWKSTAKYF